MPFVYWLIFHLKVEDFFTLGTPVFWTPMFKGTGEKKYSETFGSIWLDVGMLWSSEHLDKMVTATKQFGR